MTETAKWQIVTGAVLLLVGTAIILGVSGKFVPGVPAVVGSLAALGLAAGALLVGTSDSDGRPV